ncbi:hypothetical protein AnigIFM63604_004664 [Aspergillus niger]|uniref:Uncharacterized protein n=1 Tax=Aspergillus niger TaxID=5061 RepID=A0A9W6EGY5_ASPNG|nr:hypothetical protein AnigIFM63604_004664 [Aspergillus niger]
MITDIVKLSGTVDLDAETVNKTLSRWIDDGHRVDSLCQSLGRSNGKYLGHIFGSLGSVSNEFVRVIPLKGEERDIKIEDIRKCSQPDEMTYSLASTIFAHVWRMLDQRIKEALGDKAWEYQYDPLIWAHNEGNNISEEAMLAPQSPEGTHGQDCDPGIRRPDSAQHLPNEGGASILPVDGYDPLRYINYIEPNLSTSSYDPLRDMNPVEGHGEGAYAFDHLKSVDRVRPQLQEHHGHLCHMNSVDSNQLEHGYNPLDYVNPVEVGLAEDSHDPSRFISPAGSDLPVGGYDPLRYVNPVEVGLAQDSRDPFHFISPVGSDLPAGGYDPLRYVNPVEVGLTQDSHDPFHFISPVGSDLPAGGYDPLHYVNPVEPDLPRSGYDPVHHISPVELQASVASVNMNRGDDFTQRLSHSPYTDGMLDPRQIRSPQHSTNGGITFRVIPVT